MKTLIALIALSAVAVAAPADKKKKAAPVSKAAPAAQPLVIPKDAVANANGTYAYTDKEGKKWIYSKTPFGVWRTQDTGAAPVASPESKDQFVKVIDAGETVKFERQSPFGTTKWEKKKTDLTDEERALVQQQTPQQQPAPQQPE
jgi:hypothetical protein